VKTSIFFIGFVPNSFFSQKLINPLILSDFGLFRETLNRF